MRHKLILPLLFAFSFSKAFGQNTRRPETLKPFVLGVVDTVHSLILNEKRILNIYLPEGYSADTAPPYPVIYLLDGSADEDFIHIAGLVQFCNFSWVDLLPKSIVVGIANVDRRRDFTFPTRIERDKKDHPTSGGSEKFIAFIETELQPFIQQHYKTSGTRTLLGQSLGGLLATEILFKKPQLFTHYAIISPSLWWDKESLLTLRPAGVSQNTRVFVGVGKEGKVMENDAKQLVKLLKSGKQDRLRVDFRYMNDKNHADILHEAVYHAFEYFKQ